MPAAPSAGFKPQGAAPLLLAAFLFALLGGFGESARAQQAEDKGIGASTDIEHPADVAPDEAELRLEDELIDPDDFDPESLMRPDTKAGRGDGPPPQSTEESKRDKLAPPSFEDLPLAAPPDKPKLLAQLYAELGKTRDEEAAAPIIEAIETLWRTSGSPTVDLLMLRAERFAKTDDLELALKIIDAALEMAPEQAEAWYLRAKVHYQKKEYGNAIADLRRALDRDPKHYAAMNDLGAALQAVGAKKDALDAYRKAIAVNPFLDETKRAVEELRREVEGQDI